MIRNPSFPDTLYLKNIDMNNKINSCEHVYDLRNVFDNMNNTHIYFDVGHMSDFGNEIIATKMFEEFKTIIKNDVEGNNIHGSEDSN